MLGREPHRCCPGGRAWRELLAPGGMELAEGDLAFRAKTVRMESRTIPFALWNGRDRDAVVRFEEGRCAPRLPP